jgi:hypothetical protein
MECCLEPMVFKDRSTARRLWHVWSCMKCGDKFELIDPAMCEGEEP